MSEKTKTTYEDVLNYLKNMKPGDVVKASESAFKLNEIKKTTVAVLGDILNKFATPGLVSEKSDNPYGMFHHAAPKGVETAEQTAQPTLAQ